MFLDYINNIITYVFMYIYIYNKENPFSRSSLIVKRKYVYIVLNLLNERSHSHEVTRVYPL